MKHLTSLAGFTPPHLLSGMAEDTPLLVALSGGADSVALLALLVNYAAETGASLSVAHVNHKLRGPDSDRDSAFCRALAEKHGLPFYLLEADVGKMAKENRRGVEEQARLVRYDFFASIMAANDIPLLVTAHHADDNAETVLLHITRGSGLHGLSGIAPVREFATGKLLRPMLLATKEEILCFCEQNELAYVTDKTNSDTDYARNRIRHNVMPELARINPSVATSLSRLCRSVSRDDDFIDTCARTFLDTHITADGSLPLTALCQTHPALSTRAVAILLTPLLDELSAVHVESVMKLVKNGVPHSSLDLGNGVKACVEDESLRLLKESAPLATHFDFQIPLHEGENPIPEADMLILIEKDSSPKNQQTVKNIYKKATTTYISSATIYDSFIARPRQDGDVILAGGMHKKVKKLMCDRKIPLALRSRLPIVCDADGILWIPLTAQRDGTSGDKKVKITLFYND